MESFLNFVPSDEKRKSPRAMENFSSSAGSKHSAGFVSFSCDLRELRHVIGELLPCCKVLLVHYILYIALHLCPPGIHLPDGLLLLQLPEASDELVDGVQVGVVKGRGGWFRRCPGKRFHGQEEPRVKFDPHPTPAPGAQAK